MNSNWNTLVTPVDGYDNSRNIYNDETFIHGFPLRMPDEGYDTDRDIYNAETFGHITKRKKPAAFDAPPGLDACKRFKSVQELYGRPPLHSSAQQDEARIRSIVRDEIYHAARNAVQATRPVASIVRPDDSNPSYLTPRHGSISKASCSPPRPGRIYAPTGRIYAPTEAPWAPNRRQFQRSYHTNEVYGCGRTGWEIMCDNNPNLLKEENNLLSMMGCNFDDLQCDH